MKQIIAKSSKILISLVIGLALTGFANSAVAFTLYNSYSNLSLKLVDVTSEDDNAIGQGDWSVLYETYFIDADAFTDGDGSAAYDYTPETTGALYIGQAVTLSSLASGWTGPGIAESYAAIGLDLRVDNASWADDLFFTFDYCFEIYASVESAAGLAGNDALATAGVDILDDFFSIDVLEFLSADLLSGQEKDAFVYRGSFSFSLPADEANNISAVISSDGKATGAAPVPEPGTFMLLSVMLAGTAAVRFYKK